MDTPFVPSQWREVRVGKKRFNFLLNSQGLEDALKTEEEVYKVCFSSLWHGSPRFTPEQLLQPGADINVLLQGKQIIYFTAGQEAERTGSMKMNGNDIPPNRNICLHTNNSKRESGLHSPSAVDTVDISVLTPMNEASPHNTTLDSGYSTLKNNSKNSVFLCNNSIVEESDNECSYPQTSNKYQPLLGLSSIPQKLSKMISNTISSPSSSSLNQRSPGIPLCKAPPSCEYLDLTKDEGIVVDVSDGYESGGSVIIMEAGEENGVVYKGGGPKMSSNQSQVFNCCGVALSQVDLDTLRPFHWLNDQVINAYMKLLMKSYNPPPGAKSSGVRVYITSTFFYTKLQSTGYTGVEKWLQKVNMSRLRLLLMPVHLGCHWCLAAVDFRNKSIAYFDSMGGKNVTCLKKLKQFLLRCSLEKKIRHVQHWRLYYPQDIPHQDNTSDCGVFTCQFAHWLCNTKLRSCNKFHPHVPFSHKHMPQFRLLMIEQLKSETLYTHNRN